MSFVLALGSSTPDSVLRIAKEVATDGTNEWMRVLPNGGCEDLRYAECTSEFSIIEAALLTGEVISIQLSKGPQLNTLLGLYTPQFCGSTWGDWRCLLEGEGPTLEEWYERCRRDLGIRFAGIFADEFPDLDVEHVTGATFPWDDWRFREGGVRDIGGNWVERKADSGASR